MSKDPSDYFSPEAREARRQVRLSKYASLSGQVGRSFTATEKKLTTQNAGLHAVAMVREILNNYNLPGLPRLSYSGLRNARVAANTSKLEDGVVTVNASLRSTSGIQMAFDIPVVIHEGKLLEPSVIVHNGEARVIAQSTFDNITDRNTIKDPMPVRELYSAPLENHMAEQLYSDRPKYTKVQRGMFSLQGNRDNLRRAMRGQELVASEDHEATMDYEAGPVSRPKPPKAPKPFGMKPPKPGKSTKPGKLCSRCNHSPCVCPNKRKKAQDSMELVAKVNREVTMMRDDGLSDIDIKQAVFTKYGPEIAASVFHGE